MGPACRAPQSQPQRLDGDAGRNAGPIKRRLVTAGVAEGQNGEALGGEVVEAVVRSVHGGQDRRPGAQNLSLAVRVRSVPCDWPECCARRPPSGPDRATAECSGLTQIVGAPACDWLVLRGEHLLPSTSCRCCRGSGVAARNAADRSLQGLCNHTAVGGQSPAHGAQKPLAPVQFQRERTGEGRFPRGRGFHRC